MPGFLGKGNEIGPRVVAWEGCLPATVPARMRANAFSMSAVQIMGSDEDVGSVKGRV